jgi:hypothetical protein
MFIHSWQGSKENIGDAAVSSICAPTHNNKLVVSPYDGAGMVKLRSFLATFNRPTTKAFSNKKPSQN